MPHDLDLYDRTVGDGELVLGDILGAVERANPLPLGTYWVDVPGKSIPAFQQWMRTNKGPFKHLASETTKDDTYGDVLWVKFEVTSPLQWEGPGFPTIIKQGEAVATKDDTSTGAAVAKQVRSDYEANPLKDVTDPLKPIVKNVAETASSVLPSKWWLVGALGVAGLVALALFTGNVKALAAPVLKRL